MSSLEAPSASQRDLARYITPRLCSNLRKFVDFRVALIQEKLPGVVSSWENFMDRLKLLDALQPFEDGCVDDLLGQPGNLDIDA